MSVDIQEKMVRLKEASKLLHVTADTIRNWDKAGKIKLTRTTGGHRLVPISEINRINAFRRPHEEPIEG